MFNEAEEDQDLPILEQIYRIVKLISLFQNYPVICAEHELYQLLLSDDYYIFIFGTLEYMMMAETTHRQFFKEVLSFEKVVDLKDKQIENNIHFTYRLLYLRDCALGHFLDDRSMNMISIIIINNYTEILKHIQSNKEIMNSLFDSLREYNLLALKMIYEICVVLKSSEIDKPSLFKTFEDYNLFETLEQILGQKNSTEFLSQPKSLKGNNSKKGKVTNKMETNKACFYAIEILNSSFIYNPEILQSLAVCEKQKFLNYPLLRLIFTQFLGLKEKKEIILYSDVIKGFMSNEKENEVQLVILSEFYPKLLAFIDTTDSELLVEVILDIFIVTIKFFGEKNQEFLLSSIDTIVSVLDSKKKFLHIIVMQFLRFFLDPQNIDLVLKFKPAVKKASKIFFSQRSYNLIYSVTYCFFNTIQEFNIKILLKELEIHSNNYRSHKFYPIVEEILKRSKSSMEGSEGKREKKHSIDSSSQNLVIDNFSFIYTPDKNHAGIETFKKNKPTSPTKSAPPPNLGRKRKIVDYDEDDEDDIFPNPQKKIH